MLAGKYAAPKTEISQIIGSLFIELEEPEEEELKNCQDEILIKGTTYNGNQGLLRLLSGDVFIFEGKQEDIMALREENGRYGKFTG